MFAYGTLAVPEVMFAVTGRPFAGLPARLANHARYRLRGQDYPGIRPLTGASTEGVIYLGLDKKAWKACDTFEDDGYYRRETVTVTTAAGTSYEARAYLIGPEHYARLGDEAWSIDAFREKRLDAFLTRYGLAKPINRHGRVGR